MNIIKSQNKETRLRKRPTGNEEARWSLAKSKKVSKYITTKYEITLSYSVV